MEKVEQKFSVLILTYNEDSNIADCLSSVSWCNDIVVLDSFSTDSTVETAKSLGARVYKRKFDDFGSHRNWAHENISFKYEWVFHLDADERFSEALKVACENAILENKHSGFFVPNRMIFLGKWIKHCTRYPYHQVRLVKPSEMRFTNLGHGQMEGPMERGAGYINLPYEHYNFSKGVSDWVRRHNSYSDIEADHAIRDEMKEDFHFWRLFSREKIYRRRTIKVLGRRMPGKSVLKFLYLYVLSLGFLDGIPGLYYCLLQAYYQMLIDVKIREKRRRAAGLPV